MIAEGDGICAETNAAVGTVDASSTDAPAALSQKADLYDGMVQRLEELASGLSDPQLDDFVSAGKDLVQAEKDAQLAAERNDSAALSSAQSSADTALASFQSAAQAYGFKECGQGPTQPAALPSGTTGATAPVVPSSPSTTTPVTPVAPSTTTPVTPVAPSTTPAAPAPTPAPTGGAGGGAGGTGTGGGGGSAPSGGSGSGGIGPG
jgi:hypothetical protein